MESNSFLNALTRNIASTCNERNPGDESNNSQQHSFQIRFFFKPILCLYCQDYIWGEGHLGYGCVNCAQCIHSKCKLFLTLNPSSIADSQKLCQLNKCTLRDSLQIDSITRPNLFPIANWSVDMVKEWLAVVNLHRYAEVFATYNINGSKLLNLDIYQLYAFRIRDTYHHSAILQCRDELLYKSQQYSTYHQMLKEQEQAKQYLIANPYKADHHHFLVHTISKLTDCSQCARPLLGIVNQSLLCQKCGIIVHRHCSSTGLPTCVANKSKVNSNKHHLFGVSLFDLTANNDSETPDVPLLLTKSFRAIEERAYMNNEDLYDVYRLSADTSKIDHIKQQLNENGVELVNLDNYDLNTIAALVKTFLRDLQDTVIPESMYEKLIASAQTASSEELRSLIRENLPPLHLACLTEIMCHLIRVWIYQFRVRGCHYLPDKLFHIFRSILMRPPWEKITEIVYNTDKQTLVIQRLMLEYNWGIELPEYKIRPKRPVYASISAQPLVSSTNKLQTSSLRERRNSLSEVPWYWGDISRDETILILKNCPDGSFLVRDSTDKNMDSPYTLCVMKGSFVKSIKIFKQDLSEPGKQRQYLYDIEKPCRFESTQALITYYSRVSLKEYNHNLDLVLTYGVSKFKFGKTSEWSIDKLYSSFRDAFQQYEQLTKKCDGLESEISNIREDLNQKKLASSALDKIIQIYNEQVEQVDKMISDKLLKKTNAISTTRLLVSQLMPTGFTVNNKSNNYEISEEDDTDRLISDNRTKLKERIDDLHIKKDGIKSEVDYLNTILNQLQEDLDVFKPELIELRKKRENYHMWLLQRGENDDKIQKELKTSLNSGLLGLEKSPSTDLSVQTSASSLTSTADQSMNSSISSTTPSENSQKAKKLNCSNILIESAFRNKKSLTKDDSATSLTAPSLPPPPAPVECVHANSLNWYSAECSRDQAVETLKSRENGTYLVRPSSNPAAKYVISLVINNQIKHVLIEENQSGCFLKSSRATDSSKSISNQSSSSLNPSESDYTYNSSFVVIKFKTLTELVVYYSTHQIQTNNQLLDTCLVHPAFAMDRF